MTLLENKRFATWCTSFDSLKNTNKVFDILTLGYIEAFEVTKSLSLQLELSLSWVGTTLVGYDNLSKEQFASPQCFSIDIGIF